MTDIKYKVIDVSEHNTITDANWKTIKSKGYVVVLRIGLRGSVKSNKEYYGKIRYDFKFKEYLSACKKYEIPCSVYFFPTSITEEEAHEEGKWLVNALKDNKVEPVLPICQDTEMVDGGNGRADKLSKANRTKFINIVNQHLKDAGYKYGVYASTSWYKDKLNDNDLMSGTYRWVAQNPKLTYTTHDVFMWQYGTMTISNKKIDANNCYIDLIKKESSTSTKTASATTATTATKTVKITETMVINKMIEYAKDEIGYVEKKSNKDLYSKTANAGSNNYTKYGYEMHQLQPSNMDFPAAWCDAFCDWIILQTCKFYGYGAKEAKQVLCGDFDDYTVRSADYYKKKGRWFTKPQKGDQIFFKNNSGICHTGIVTEVTSTKVFTIEGNTSTASGVVANGGGVASKSYSISYNRIAGYGRPDWSSIVGTQKVTVAKTTSELKGNSKTKYTISGTGTPNKTVKQFTGTVSVNTRLNIRTGPGTNYGIVSFSPLTNGKKVDIYDAILDKNGATWYYIKLNGKYGFVSASYIKKT